MKKVYGVINPWQLDVYTHTIRMNMSEISGKDRQLGSFEVIANPMHQLNQILSLIGGVLRGPESLHGGPQDRCYIW